MYESIEALPKDFVERERDIGLNAAVVFFGSLTQSGLELPSIVVYEGEFEVDITPIIGEVGII